MKKDEPPPYRDKRLQQFVAGYRVRDFQAFERQLRKRLTILEDAQSKDDLRLLPSNHFEALIGDRKGQFSIRINQQWRLCFEWSESELTFSRSEEHTSELQSHLNLVCRLLLEKKNIKGQVTFHVQ